MSRVSGEQLESWQEGIGAAPCSAAFFLRTNSLRYVTIRIWVNDGPI